MKNDITAVRNLMIAQMEKLVNPEEGETPDIETAKAVASLGKVLVESAKAEVLYIRTMHSEGIQIKGTGFIKEDIKVLGQ
jgi:hypothetical protein